MDGQKGMKVDGPQNCVGNIKKVKVDGLRMRGRSKRDESGRSSKLPIQIRVTSE